MQLSTADPDQHHAYTGVGYELIIRPPGAYCITAPECYHFLDVHIGGTKGRYLVDDLEGLGAASPSNSFVFLPANGSYQVQAVKSGWSVQLLVDPDRFESVLETLPTVDAHSMGLICHTHDESLVGIATVLRDMTTASYGQLPSEYANALATSLMVRTAYHFSGALIVAPKNVALPSRIQTVLDYVEENLENPLSLNELADVANASPYHFARMFRRATSRSLHQYITERRLERAKRLLTETDSGIAQISYECGFGSQSHMTNVFTKILGITPGALRRVAR